MSKMDELRKAAENIEKGKCVSAFTNLTSTHFRDGVMMERGAPYAPLEEIRMESDTYGKVVNEFYSKCLIQSKLSGAPKRKTSRKSRKK